MEKKHFSDREVILTRVHVSRPDTVLEKHVSIVADFGMEHTKDYMVLII